MAADLEFLDEVEIFLRAESLPRVVTPCESIENDQVFKFPCGEFVAPNANESSSEEVDRDNKTSSSNEYKNNLDSSNDETQPKDDRRKRYRTRVKNEHQELKRMEKELSWKKQEIIDAREGRTTNARTDLIVSKSFWQDMAIRQREEREQAETEQKRLLAAVQSQASYIENLCAILRERPSRSNEHQLDNHKWFRLKSSDTVLFKAFIQEANDCYSRIDEVFAECGMASQPMVEIHSVRRYSSETGMEYAQYVNKIMQPFNFEATCKFMWDGTNVPYRQHEREIYSEVEDLENTRDIKFRLKKTLTCGSTVSILKRVVARRYVVDKRMVFVFKSFSEGDGIFSGMDTDETGWSIIRPQNDASKRMTLMEFCARQVPVPYLTANTCDPAVKDFKNMMEDAVEKDAQVVAVQLGKLLRNNTTVV